MLTNLEEVAAAAVTLLAPYTPYLLAAGKAGGKKVVETVAEKGGEEMWEKAQALWGKLKSYFSGTPQLEATAAAVAADPGDKTYREGLKKALVTCLEKHPELAPELVELMGGEESMQALLISDSRAEDLSQDMEGAGTQYMNINRSVVKGVRQKKTG
jgi:hypothetical protein